MSPHIHRYTYIYKHIHTYIHTYIAYIHTHMHTPTLDIHFYTERERKGERGREIQMGKFQHWQQYLFSFINKKNIQED